MSMHVNCMSIHSMVGPTIIPSVCPLFCPSVCPSIYPYVCDCKNSKIYCKIKWNQLEVNRTIQRKQISSIKWEKIMKKKMHWEAASLFVRLDTKRLPSRFLSTARQKMPFSSRQRSWRNCQLSSLNTFRSKRYLLQAPAGGRWEVGGKRWAVGGDHWAVGGD